MNSTFDRVKQVCVSVLCFDAEKVTAASTFIDDLGADSLDLVELVMTIEEEFGVEIPDNEAEMCLTVGDAVKHLERIAA